ncbi:hypothetical protein OUZ56_005725 [Daphnia magna]|uniref:Uncharacterized protein n=1 Tax=Daphnia magna TaxID=35525 RepID=A0ABQ9YTL1_9CRUS|nr:hypothetical protein OUZ56_005725 [Daphnia magna]
MYRISLDTLRSSLSFSWLWTLPHLQEIRNKSKVLTEPKFPRSQKQVGPKPEDIGTVSKGSYSYTSPDGVVHIINWVAEENGF